jgi:tetratricopeptide (TPR) repeat protein
MIGLLLDDDPEEAWAHALVARRLGARLAVVREAVGLAAYRAGLFAEALAEFRTARRLNGSQAYLPHLADCERGLGRPERALALASSPEASQLDWSARVELLIVAAGARADLGQADTAVAMLDIPELHRDEPSTWQARLRTAYAEVLNTAGRQDEAELWHRRAAEVDPAPAGEGIEDLADEDDLFIADLEEDDIVLDEDDDVTDPQLGTAPPPTGEDTPLEHPSGTGVDDVTAPDPTGLGEGPDPAEDAVAR